MYLCLCVYACVCARLCFYTQELEIAALGHSSVPLGSLDTITLFVYMYDHSYIHIYIYTHTYVHIFLCACVCVCVYTQEQSIASLRHSKITFGSLHTNILYIYISMNIFTYIQIYIYICAYICVCVCVCVCVYVCICAHTDVMNSRTRPQQRRTRGSPHQHTAHIYI